jgi:FMN phosphatase YigB (HAD superfamily)
MIDTIIFDFGDVFINLDKQGAMDNALDLFGLDTFEPDMINVNMQYEIGQISTQDFIRFYRVKFPFLTEDQIINAWNYILKDFPAYRLDFLLELRQQSQYKLVLLSNTNDLHIECVKRQVPFYETFKNCFDAFYLSQEIHLRKPDSRIFEYVVNKNQIQANQCLFIDDTRENTDSAAELGIHIWNIDELNEDVVDLFTIKRDLF